MAENFAVRLREIREAKGLTRGQLAVLSGVKVAAIRDLEGGVYPPSWETVRKLADALAITTDAFRQEPSGTPKKRGRGRPRKTDLPPGE